MAYVAKVTAGGNSGMLIGSTLYGVCSTAAATVAKTVTISGFDTLITGVTIHVKFTNRNTAKFPTLKVGSTAAKEIKLYNTVGAGDVERETSWQNGAVISFTYDGNYWVMNDYLYYIHAERITEGYISPACFSPGIAPTMYKNGKNPSDYHFLRLSPIGPIEENVSTRMELCDDNANKYSYAYTKFRQEQNGSGNYTFHMLMVVNDTMYADYIFHIQTYSYHIQSTSSIRALSAKNETFNFTNKKFILDYQAQGDHNLKIGLDMSTVNDTEMLFHVRMYIYNIFSINIGDLVHVGVASTNTNPYSSYRRIITPS